MPNWREAVRRLGQDRAVVTSGPWQWRKLILEDKLLKGSVERLNYVTDSLAAVGEEWTVSVWRPVDPGSAGPADSGPASYRVALVTWGPFLDMTAEEVSVHMEKVYG